MPSHLLVVCCCVLKLVLPMHSLSYSIVLAELGTRPNAWNSAASFGKHHFKIHNVVLSFCSNHWSHQLSTDATRTTCENTKHTSRRFLLAQSAREWCLGLTRASWHSQEYIFRAGVVRHGSQLGSLCDLPWNQTPGKAPSDPKALIVANQNEVCLYSFSHLVASGDPVSFLTSTGGFAFNGGLPGTVAAPPPTWSAANIRDSSFTDVTLPADITAVPLPDVGTALSVPQEFRLPRDVAPFFNVHWFDSANLSAVVMASSSAVDPSLAVGLEGLTGRSNTKSGASAFLLRSMQSILECTLARASSRSRASSRLARSSSCGVASSRAGSSVSLMLVEGRRRRGSGGGGPPREQGLRLLLRPPGPGGPRGARPPAVGESQDGG